ncbi:ABC transporter substrate-binding protein [Candidatus Peregrinibacteria bacterium]|nr:ABC transporter substrate-binding protein [Candidatus Peregrinibacteria bacterium]
MRKILLTLISFLLLTACNASVIESTGDQPVKTVKLGVLTSLSGDAAALGIEIQKVLDYQVEKVNQQANDYQFELVYEDGKCSGAESVLAFQKLVDFDQVDFVLGGTCSSETLAVAPIAQSNQVVLLSGWSSNPDVEKEGDFVFTISYNDDVVGQGIAKELNRYKKVAMITEQNDYNIGLQKVVRENLDSDVTIIADETFPKGGSDFRNMLEKVAVSQPEALFLNPNPGITAENLLKQLAEIPALADVQLVSQYAYLPNVSRINAAKADEGMIIIDAPTLSSPEFQQVYEGIEAEKGVIEALGMYYTASALDVLDILTETIQSEGPDPAKVKNALRKKSFEGYIGKIYFGENNFVQNIPVSRFIVQNGEAVNQ